MVLLENICEDVAEFSTDQSAVKPKIDYIVGLYGSGGRADHEFGIIKSLYIAKELTNIPLLLVTESSISCLLDKVTGSIFFVHSHRGLTIYASLTTQLIYTADLYQ